MASASEEISSNQDETEQVLLIWKKNTNKKEGKLAANEGTVNMESD